MVCAGSTIKSALIKMSKGFFPVASGPSGRVMNHFKKISYRVAEHFCWHKIWAQELDASSLKVFAGTDYYWLDDGTIVLLEVEPAGFGHSIDT